MTINRFFGEYRFLSNFWPARIFYDGIEWPSVEHAYVAQKTNDRDLRLEIASVEKPGDVKALGRKIQLREDWEKQIPYGDGFEEECAGSGKWYQPTSSLKWVVMNNLVRLKFQIPELQRRLLETKHEKLVEGNTWGDTYWGVDTKKGGFNNLGYILMDIRYGYQSGKVYSRGECKRPVDPEA